MQLDESLDLNMTEMIFRQYDPAIGRFVVIDEMAEAATDYTPYRFGFNNPIFYSDPTGLWEKVNGGYQTKDKEEITRLYGYLSDSESDGSIEGINNFIEKDIAFGESMGDALPLSTAVVNYSKSSGKSTMTGLSQHKLKNEIAFYEGRTDYIYDRSDYEMRNRILAVGTGDPISTELLRRERDDYYQPITAANYINYIGNEKSARMLVFASFLESVDSPAMELGAVTRVKPRLAGSMGMSRFSPSAKVAKSLGIKSVDEVPGNVRNMTLHEFNLKFGHLFKGRYKGRGAYMKNVALAWKGMKTGK